MIYELRVISYELKKITIIWDILNFKNMIKSKFIFNFILALFLMGCSNSSNSLFNANDIPNQDKNSFQMQGQKLPISAKTTMGGQEIKLEVAKTPKERQLGLMFRESLSENRGMLFAFSPPIIPRFWMKNVVIPLDMVFIHDGEIKSISHNVPPCKLDPCPVYGPNVPIDTVIELKGGRASELNLNIGDEIKIKSFDTFSENKKNIKI